MSMSKRLWNLFDLFLGRDQTLVELLMPSFLFGCLQGRQGEIRHLYRGFAYLHSKMMLENGGIFVCKTRHLVLPGGARVSFENQ